MLNLHHAASRLPGGRVVSGGVSFRAPGHGPGDMSARILPNAEMRNGYVVTSFAGDDPLALRDFIDAQCGLSRWGERARQERPDPHEAARQEHAREQQQIAREAEDKIKAERVRAVWQQAERDPRGTLVERYLNEHRKVNLPFDVCGHAIRFHPAGPWEATRVPMMLCAFRDIYTDEVVGLHRTRLDSVTAAEVGRKMLGRAKGAAIKLTHDSEVTMGLVLAEGVETGLAGIMLGLRPMWVTGSVGGIKVFPVLSGIEALTVCAETDDSGANAAAIEQVGTRCAEAGREVLIAVPTVSGDLNDAIRNGGR